MNRFLAKPTKLETQAVDILKKLETEQGIDSVMRVYATVAEPVMADRRNKKLDNVTRETDTLFSPKWLQGKRRTKPLLDSDYFEQPLYIDHGRCYTKKDTGTRIIISEPYGLCSERFFQLADIAREYNLRVDIDARISSWFPGSTISVRVQADEHQ